MSEDIKILIVDDEEVFRSILQYLLSPAYTVFVANSGHAAIEMAKEIVPDLILLDVIIPDISGFDVLAELKKHDLTHDIPVIFITGLDSIEDQEQGFFLGAIDYITKPFINSIVMARVRTHVQIIMHIRTIEQKCLIDALTNLPNRRSFDERFRIEWERAVREGQPISLLFIDMDKFKNYNDTYGHPFGDMLIQKSGEIYKNSLKRSTDFVARWGGDEFVILLPNTDFEGACEVAEQIGKNISSEVIPLADGGSIKTTISVGVNSATPLQTDDADVFIDNTDKALYAAKEAGRNRFCSYDDYIRMKVEKPAEEFAKAEAANKEEPHPEPSGKTLESVIGEKASESFIELIKNIKELDVDKAIGAIGGSAGLYEKIFKIVISSVNRNIEQLDKSLFTDKDLSAFTVVIHSMKGSLRQIGYKELSVLAEALENASRAGDYSFCLSNYNVFKDKLAAFYEEARGTQTAVITNDASEVAKEKSIKKEIEAGADVKRILVVDDNVANLTLIKALLEGLYKVNSVNSGAAALRFLEKNTPNLILLDVEMPNMGGKEVFSAIKANPRLSGIPVIFLTGLTDMESEAEAFKLGVSDYMHKPVNDTIMLHRIKMQLELQHLRAGT